MIDVVQENKHGNKLRAAALTRFTCVLPIRCFRAAKDASLRSSWGTFAKVILHYARARCRMTYGSLFIPKFTYHP
ncbi:MAG: hypothetical protein IKG66_09920, partial [Lachnospiraceae bacterium]|nr:hypothetical protein [Lachnospiraceae bacterium]